MCFSYEAQALWLAVKINIQELIKLQTNAKELLNLVGDFLFKSKECYKVCLILHEVILVGDDIDILISNNLFGHIPLVILQFRIRSILMTLNLFH